MNTLYLLRHASAQPLGEGGDRARPLDLAGRRAAHILAARYPGRLAPAIVLCSPALRTRETLELIASAFAKPPPVLLEEALYLASADRLLGRLRSLEPDVDAVLLIGHNPGLHELAMLLSDVATGSLIARVAAGFPPAALATFSIAVEWAALDRRRARLVGFVRPEDVS